MDQLMRAGKATSLPGDYEKIAMFALRWVYETPEQPTFETSPVLHLLWQAVKNYLKELGE